MKEVLSMDFTYETVILGKEIEGERKSVYGVKVKDKTGRLLGLVEDVSTDKMRVNALVMLCNELQLSSMHFYDAINDFIISY